ncbi:uncharacterized protein LOC144625714 [Crassostrea virginica]
MIRSSEGLAENIKNLYIGLIRNETWDILDFVPNETVEDQELKSLLMHLFILYKIAPKDARICQPLINISFCQTPLPEYMPTMPENLSFSQLRDFLDGGRNAQMYSEYTNTCY